MVVMKGLFVRIPLQQAELLDRACAARGMTKQGVVRSALDVELTGRAIPATTHPGDAVLSLDELVVLLGVDERLVRERVEAGDIPGRRFGQTWRFSRDAV